MDFLHCGWIFYLYFHSADLPAAHVRIFGSWSAHVSNDTWPLGVQPEMHWSLTPDVRQHSGNKYIFKIMVWLLFMWVLFYLWGCSFNYVGVLFYLWGCCFIHGGALLFMGVLVLSRVLLILNLQHYHLIDKTQWLTRDIHWCSYWSIIRADLSCIINL